MESVETIAVQGSHGACCGGDSPCRIFTNCLSNVAVEVSGSTFVCPGEMVCQTRSVFDAPQCTSARQTDFFCQANGYNSASTVYLNLDVSTTSSAMPTVSARPAWSATSTPPATSTESTPPATSAKSVPSTTSVPSTSTPASSVIPSSSTASSSTASSSTASSSAASSSPISFSRVSSSTASSATSKLDPAATSLTATAAAAPSLNSTSAAAAAAETPLSTSTPAWIAGAVIGPLAVAALAGLAFWLGKRRAASRSSGNPAELGVVSPGEGGSFEYSTLDEAAALNLLAGKPYEQQRWTRASELGGDQPAYAAAVPPLSEAPGEEFAVRELP
ncbi:hypothetical protein B0T26DRAFT_735458 [Lasiosphaeria miniovina]|uniref:Uncharacterized protein n=1 Tax=Lasiosphaeria miniovina TaxID=1954250 RepID=A0AA40DHX0_9PEZI|nr:uncharacterized protein B0T26DRAFT_735458 [Lasiosphaeria miniovina]KAK0701976.1 hypothetical protein B0T26DRAFT_735458 [Lasiosphaeria miniovina]